MSETDSPNVLWVVVDCLRDDALSTNGYHRPTTEPIDDRLAADFVRFENACTQSGFTLNVISSLVTGTYPTTHGVLRWSDTFPEDVPAYADAIADSSLPPATAIPGMNFVTEEWGVDRAFDRVHNLEEAKGTRACEQARAGEIREEAERVVTGADGFNAMLWFFDLHEPWLSDRAFDGDNPKRDSYDTELRYVAEQLDELFATLEAAGRYEDTLVIVTGDHGDIFTEHQNLPWNRYTALAERLPLARRILYGNGYVGHIGRPFVEELVDVPLFVKLPGSEHGGTCVEGQVELVDLLPTILDVAGVSELETVEGETLLPKVRGEEDGKAYVRAEMSPEPVAGFFRMVRGTEYKYLRHDPPSLGDIQNPARDTLLYLARRFLTPEEVLVERADEHRNLVDDRPEVAADLRRVMDGWAQDVDADAGISEERREELEQLGYL
ncbi:MAG: sulfatase [Halorientalis sp.]